MKRRIATAILLLLLVVIAGCETGQMASNGENQAPPPQITTEDPMPLEPPAPAEAHEQENTAVEKAEASPQDDKAEPATASSENSFHLHLSQDFGREKLDSRQVKVSDNNLLDYMREEWQVKTGYGGGFVQAIIGLESAYSSGIRYDWFFYVNGVGSPMGANKINPSPGHIIWWDYHFWSTGPGQSAVIGCYPQPFKNRGITILTTQRCMELALQCGEAMGASGIRTVEIADLSQNISLLERPTVPVMVIGAWTELEENPYLQKWNESYRQNGSSIHFTDNGVELLAADGQVQRTMGEGTGVIVASGKGLGDNNPLWLVAGVDDQGVKEAARILCSQPEELRWKYGLAVQGSQIMALPAD
jgi:hypothetical protein